MKIKLAHHYWQDKTNARWNPDRFPYPAIEEEIKKSYAILESERPKWKQYGKITVFFDYRPTKDIYGRDIVPISFAFVPDCQNPEQCYSFIIKRLGQTLTKQTEMEVKLASENSVNIRKNRLIIIFGFCVVLLALIIGVGYFIGDGDKANKTPSISDFKENNSFRTHSKYDNGEIDVQASGQTTIVSNATSTQQMENIDKQPRLPYQNSDIQNNEKELSKPSRLCVQKDILEKMDECARLYFDKYCDKNVMELKKFHEWNMKTNPAACSRKKIPIDSKEYPIFRKDVDIDGTIKREMEALFNKGR